MDRIPLPAPFGVGTKVRYLGEAQTFEEDGTPILARGMIFTIEEVRPGRRGTLRPLPYEDGDEELDEPLLDTTRDAYSVYYETRGSGRRSGRIIWPDRAHEWELVT